MSYKLITLVLVAFSSSVALAADYKNRLDCYRQIVGPQRSSPPIVFEFKKSHDGMPAGIYVFDKTKSFFCPSPAGARPNYIILNAGGKYLPYSDEFPIPSNGTTPNMSPPPTPETPTNVNCEDNELPRMAQAFDAEIISEIDSFGSGRPAGNKALVRQEFDTIATKVNACMKLIPSLGTPLFEARQRIYKFYNSDKDLEVEVPKSTK